jgi:hypothetical protein
MRNHGNDTGQTAKKTFVVGFKHYGKQRQSITYPAAKIILTYDKIISRLLAAKSHSHQLY